MDPQIPGMPPTVNSQTDGIAIPLNMPTEPISDPNIPASLAPPTAQTPAIETRPGGYLQTGIGGEQDVQQAVNQAVPSTPVPKAQPNSAQTSDFDVPKTAGSPQTAPDQFGAGMKGIENQMIASSKAEQQVYGNMAAAEEAKAKAGIAVHEAQATEAAAAQARVQERYTQVDRDVSAQMTQLNDLRSNFLNEKFEPGKIDAQRSNPFASDSVSRQLMAGIAVGLGGFAAGMLGGSNSAMDIINKTIDRDIDAQKFDAQQKEQAFKLGLEGKIQAGNTTNQIMAGLEKQFGNSIMAEDAYKSLRLEQTAAALAKIGSKNDAVLKSGPYQIMQQQLNQQIAQTKMQFMEMARNRAIQENFGKAIDNPNVEIPMSYRSLLSKEQNATLNERDERLVPAAGAFAKDKESAKSFNKEVTPMLTARDGLNEVLRLSKTYNKLNPVERNEMETKLKVLPGQLKELYVGNARFTETELKMITDAIGNPNSVTDFMNLQPQKLKFVTQMLDGKIKREVQSTFVNPGSIQRKLNGDISGNGVALRERK